MSLKRPRAGILAIRMMRRCCRWLEALERGSGVSRLAAGKPEGAILRFWLGESPKGVRSAMRSKWLVHAESGHAIWRDARWTVRADASPLGLGSMAAHGHLDALHVSLWFEQHALVIDPGTGAYYGHPRCALCSPHGRRTTALCRFQADRHRSVSVPFSG
jgi:hypothetical protein